MTTFVHVGKQPITYQGVWYVNGQRLEADPEDPQIKFFVQIGALMAVTDAEDEDE